MLPTSLPLGYEKISSPVGTSKKDACIHNDGLNQKISTILVSHANRKDICFSMSIIHYEQILLQAIVIYCISLRGDSNPLYDFYLHSKTPSSAVARQTANSSQHLSRKHAT